MTFLRIYTCLPVSVFFSFFFSLGIVQYTTCQFFLPTCRFLLVGVRGKGCATYSQYPRLANSVLGNQTHKKPAGAKRRKTHSPVPYPLTWPSHQPISRPTHPPIHPPINLPIKPRGPSTNQFTNQATHRLFTQNKTEEF